MCWLCLWAPLLLVGPFWQPLWQPLWLLVEAAPLPEWAPHPAQLASDLLGPTEPWPSHSSELPPESPQAFTPPAPELGGFHYLGSSAPAQTLVPPQELTETLVQFLDRDSVGEVPPEADEDLNDKPTQPERLPDVVSSLGWDQNQTVASPSQLKSKIKTVRLGQAEDR